MSERHVFSDNNHDGGERTFGECGRGAELVAYLYGEASPAEERQFSTHLQSCAACREEASAFRVVRAGLGEWREEVVSAAPPVRVAPGLLAAPAVNVRPVRERSARAALREFFALSPLWLKTGGAFAAVAVCALAVLALARAEVRWDEHGFAFNTGGAARTFETIREVQTPGTYTEQQHNELADARVRQALAEQLAAKASQEGPAIVAARVEDSTSVAVNVPVKAERPSRRNRATPVKGNKAAQPRDEFLPEDNLPGLYDLLRAAN